MAQRSRLLQLMCGFLTTLDRPGINQLYFIAFLLGGNVFLTFGGPGIAGRSRREVDFQAKCQDAPR